MNSGNAEISGTVKEDDLNPIPGTPIALKDPKGNVMETTTTNENGEYVFDAVEPGDNIIGESTTIPLQKERFLRRPDRVAADANTTIERVGAPSSVSMKMVNNRRDEDVRMHACCRYNILNYHRYLYLLSTVIKSDYFQHQGVVLVQLQITRNVVHEQTHIQFIENNARDVNAIISPDATPVGMEGSAPIFNVAYPDMGIGTLVHLRSERRRNPRIQ